jgi:hypothetical protein
MRRFYIRPIEDKDPSWWSQNKGVLFNVTLRIGTAIFVFWAVALISWFFSEGIDIPF